MSPKEFHNDFETFFLFTLMMLFATGCFMVGPLHAQSDSDYKPTSLFDGDVYCVSYASTNFSYPIASSSHVASIWNYGPGGVKFYVKGTMGITWNGGSVTPEPREKSGTISANNGGGDEVNFSFSLRGKPAGRGSISASTEVKVRHLPTNAVQWGRTANASNNFFLP
ncbi:hypothetical protein F4054_06065 [Candidatus Poribacteria bacterium]|nr:hypothetical protein [Candidatus Poribacteria bacterium]MYK21809.1 hypothetical protein [Candidatus Poribacteria bacterium]